jgi:origin recognition complex subunit 1
MDELDQLLTAKQDVVYNFFNWPTMRDSQLFVIAVANRMDLPQHLAAKIKSRLGAFLILYRVIWRVLYCFSSRRDTLLTAARQC